MSLELRGWRQASETCPASQIRVMDLVATPGLSVYSEDTPIPATCNAPPISRADSASLKSRSQGGKTFPLRRGIFDRAYTDCGLAFEREEAL
jgi:hypothetical protein